MTALEYIIYVALCAASISYTICHAGIFKSFREWLSKFHSKLEELIFCPYCFCHYVILTIMFTTKHLSEYLLPISGFIVYDFLFTWFCIVCVTSLLHYVMLLAYKPVLDYMTHRLIEKQQQLKRQKKADGSSS